MQHETFRLGLTRLEMRDCPAGYEGTYWDDLEDTNNPNGDHHDYITVNTTGGLLRLGENYPNSTGVLKGKSTFTITNVRASDSSIDTFSYTITGKLNGLLVVDGHSYSNVTVRIVEAKDGSSAYYSLVSNEPDGNFNGQLFAFIPLQKHINFRPVIPPVPPVSGGYTARGTSDNASTPTPIGPVAFTVTDEFDEPESIQVSATASNPGLFSDIALTANGVQHTITLTPAGNSTGSSVITIKAVDTEGATTTTDFTVTVFGGSPPTQSIARDDAYTATYQTNRETGQLGMVAFISPLANDTIVGAVPGNIRWTVPFNQSIYGPYTDQSQAAGTPVYMYVCKPGFVGEDHFQYFWTDATGVEHSANMVVVVPPVPPPPVSVARDDTYTATYQFNPATNQLGMVATLAPLANDTVIGAPPASIRWTTPFNLSIYGPYADQSAAAGTPVYQYACPAGFVGEQHFQYFWTDAGGTTRSANITVIVPSVPPNTPPGIAGALDQTLTLGALATTETLAVNDAETPSANLVVTATSSNPAIVSNVAIGPSDGGTSFRTVTPVLVPGQTGTATITLTVTDGSGATATSSFNLTVTPPVVVLPLTISDVPDQTVSIGSTVGPLTFTVGGSPAAVAGATVSATSSNPALLPAAGILVNGGGGTWTAVAFPTFNQTGIAVVTLTATDGHGATATDTFTVVVNPSSPPPPPPTSVGQPVTPVNPIVPGRKLLAVGADAGFTPVVNVYDQVGNLVQTITAYDSSFTGGVRVATGDINGDGQAELITAPGPGMPGWVRVFAAPTWGLVGEFLPYESAFTGGLYVATGDIDGDGRQDVITGTGLGGGPRVQVFGRGLEFSSIVNFFPYEDAFRGGVLVAAGDVNADGRSDIVTGTGIGGGPRVQVFSGLDLSPLANFFAYESSFRGGVFASVGDTTGDGRAEVLTGTGVGGGPVAKVFDGSALTAFAPNPDAVKSFFAFDPDFRGGVRVDSLDMNNDGRQDVVIGGGPGLSVGVVRAIDYLSLDDLYMTSGFIGGVFVGGTH